VQGVACAWRVQGQQVVKYFNTSYTFYALWAPCAIKVNDLLLPPPPPTHPPTMIAAPPPAAPDVHTQNNTSDNSSFTRRYRWASAPATLAAAALRSAAGRPCSSPRAPPARYEREI